jgi:hypothetical protein
LDFFAHLGWFTQKNGNYQFTEMGLFFAKRAAAYGVTVSICRLSVKWMICFFACYVLRTIEGEDEVHVDRK